MIEVTKSTERFRAMELIFLRESSGKVTICRANFAVMLATGGAGQVYLHTTNPLIATGDGVGNGLPGRREDREYGIHPVFIRPRFTHRKQIHSLSAKPSVERVAY